VWWSFCTNCVVELGCSRGTFCSAGSSHAKSGGDGEGVMKTFSPYVAMGLKNGNGVET